VATPGFANAARLDGRSFEIGASYSIGAAAFSLTYFDDRSHESSAVGLDRGDDKLTGIALSGKYRLGSGFNLDAVLFHSRYRGASSDTPRNESKATGFVTGLVLQF
jgi:predicted porin